MDGLEDYPLHIAAQQGRAARCRELLGLFGPDARERRGRTPLYCAAHAYSHQVYRCRLVLQLGADPFLDQGNGSSAASVAPEIEGLYSRMRPRSSAPGTGPMPGHVARKLQRELDRIAGRMARLSDTCRVLLDAGADPLAADQEGLAPAHFAILVRRTGRGRHASRD